MWPFKKKEVVLRPKKYIDYLPVGTIVKLQNDNSEYMIYGYLGNSCMSFKSNDIHFVKSQIYNETNNNSYYKADYIIKSYPDTDLNIEFYIIHEDIKEIIYLGYDDQYRKNILTCYSSLHLFTLF